MNNKRHHVVLFGSYISTCRKTVTIMVSISPQLFTNCNNKNLVLGEPHTVMPPEEHEGAPRTGGKARKEPPELA